MNEIEGRTDERTDGDEFGLDGSKGFVQEVWDDPSGGWDGPRTLLAVIVRRAASELLTPKEGTVQFVTPKTSPLQLAFMSRGPSTPVPSHYHVAQERPPSPAAEAIFVRSGRAYVRFYGFGDDGKMRNVAATTLREGDWIVLTGGGHSIDFPAPCELVEVKLGPYRGRESDKREF